MSLQSKTSTPLHMPDVREVTARELKLLLRHASIYGGEAYTWHWTDATMYAPEAPEDVPAFQEQLQTFFSGNYLFVVAEEPVLVLGNNAFKIDHPMVTVRRSVALGEGQALGRIKPNQAVRLVPGADDTVVTSMLREWTPDSQLFSG